MRFTGNQIEVHMSSGPTYPPIILTVNEFIPKDEHFLALSYAPPNVNTPTPKLEQVYAPPFGLPDNKGKGGLKKNCREHIKEIIKHERASCEAVCGDVSPLAWEIYNAVHRYRLSKDKLGNVRQLVAHQVTGTDFNSVETFTQGHEALCHALLHEPNHYFHKGLSQESD
jgi:hypothetical protein